MKTECSSCIYGHPKKTLGTAYCSKRKKIIKKNYVDLTTRVLAVKCNECNRCENIDRWDSLDLNEQNLIMLYDKALENQNLELAFSTMAELTRLGIDDITTPVSI